MNEIDIQTVGYSSTQKLSILSNSSTQRRLDLMLRYIINNTDRELLKIKTYLENQGDSLSESIKKVIDSNTLTAKDISPDVNKIVLQNDLWDALPFSYDDYVDEVQTYIFFNTKRSTNSVTLAVKGRPELLVTQYVNDTLKFVGKDDLQPNRTYMVTKWRHQNDDGSETDYWRLEELTSPKITPNANYNILHNVNSELSTSDHIVLYSNTGDDDTTMKTYNPNTVLLFSPNEGNMSGDVKVRVIGYDFLPVMKYGGVLLEQNELIEGNLYLLRYAAPNPNGTEPERVPHWVIYELDKTLGNEVFNQNDLNNG